MIEKARSVFKEARMNLRKFDTNSQELRKLIESIQSEDISDQSAHLLSGTETSKVLGLIWRPQEDLFLFDPSSIINLARSNEARLTKRIFLSISSMIFDPIGIISPVTITIKIIFQKIWERGN